MNFGNYGYHACISLRPPSARCQCPLPPQRLNTPPVLHFVCASGQHQVHDEYHHHHHPRRLHVVKTFTRHIRWQSCFPNSSEVVSMVPASNEICICNTAWPPSGTPAPARHMHHPPKATPSQTPEDRSGGQQSMSSLGFRWLPWRQAHSPPSSTQTSQRHKEALSRHIFRRGIDEGSNK